MKTPITDALVEHSFGPISYLEEYGTMVGYARRMESDRARLMEALKDLLCSCQTLNRINGKQMGDRHSEQNAIDLLSELDKS